MQKNPTPRQIALKAAFFIILIATAVLIIGLQFTHITISPFLFLAFAILTFSTSYAVISYYLKKYIYRKIKLIYKSIHEQKVSTEEGQSSVNLGEDIIGQTEQEVKNWRKSQQAEIDKYKSWADYRRRYIGDISHELKTPLFNIQGYLHTLLEGGLYDKNINLSFLKKAAKNADRLGTILEDLSAISRLESEEVVLEFETFDIKKLTEEVFEELEFTASKRGISFLFKEGASENYKVTADKENIRQVLLNLIGNSIKYSERNGKTTLSFYDMDKQILIEVADEGIGIAKEHTVFVFDRFYRVDKSRSRNRGGSGLGLSIVKHIIEAHEQGINLRSTKNVGSTFGFTLQKK